MPTKTLLPGLDTPGADDQLHPDHSRNGVSIRPLSPDQHAVVQTALELLTDEAIDHGVSLSIEHELNEYIRLRKLAGDGPVNPCVDPKHSVVGPDNSFWLRVEWQGEVVAIMAERMFYCVDFMELVRNERLWFDKGLRVISKEYRPYPAFPAFGGVVGHGVGLWVKPSLRKSGLSTFLTDYYRSVAIKSFLVDWHSCMVHASLIGHALKAYKYSEVELVIDGYWPMSGANATLHLCRVSRETMIEQLRTPTLGALALNSERVGRVRLVAGGDD
jgi:hypothetical protein